MNKRYLFYTAIGYAALCFLHSLINYIEGGPRAYLIALAGTGLVLFCLVDGLRARKAIEGAEHVVAKYDDGR